MNISDVFTKKIWKGRLSEFPNRRKLFPTDEDNVYDIERHEGEVLEEGDVISAQALNDVESRVYNGFEKIISSCDQIDIQYESDDFLEPGGWEDMTILQGKSKIGLLFSHLSTAVKNLRYIYKLLGSTDISAISDGTVTGAITQLYSDIQDITEKKPVNITKSFTSSASFAYTGLSVKIPANSYYILTFSVGYSTYAPKAISISSVDNHPSGGSYPQATGNGSAGLSVTCSGYTDQEITLYGFASYDGAHAQSGSIRGFYFAQSMKNE